MNSDGLRLNETFTTPSSVASVMTAKPWADAKSWITSGRRLFSARYTKVFDNHLGSVALAVPDPSQYGRDQDRQWGSPKP
jgi:hypothetical protein